MSPSCPLGSYSEDRIRSILFSYAKNQGKTLAWWRFVHWILRQTGGALSLWYGDDFHSHANKTHFYKKGCALGLILKVKVFGTQKWPIAHNMLNRNTVTIPREYLHVTLIKLQKKVHKCVSYLELFKGNKAVSPVSCLSFGCTESTVRGNKQFKQRHFWAAYVNLSLIICLDSTKFVVPTVFIL